MDLLTRALSAVRISCPGEVTSSLCAWNDRKTMKLNARSMQTVRMNVFFLASFPHMRKYQACLNKNRVMCNGEIPINLCCEWMLRWGICQVYCPSGTTIISENSNYEILCSIQDNNIKGLQHFMYADMAVLFQGFTRIMHNVIPSYLKLVLCSSECYFRSSTSGTTNHLNNSSPAFLEAAISWATV